MELSELKKLELRPAEDDFNGLKVVVNVNAVTGRLFRDAAEHIKQALKVESAPQRKQRKKAAGSGVEIFEGRGKAIEETCALYAKLIKGSAETPLLLSWDLTNEGQAIECSEQELRKLHPELLQDLYQFCLRVGRPKEPETRTTATNRTISDSTVAPSHTPGIPTESALPT